MGLLDGAMGDVLGSVLGGVSGGGAAGNSGAGGNPLLRMAMQLLQQHGGLSGIVDLLNRNGLAQQAASWVGTGANLPVSAEQISQALGSGALGDLAARFGLSSQDVSQGLARHLPEAVNQLTPEGRIPDNQNELIDQGLAALGGKLFGDPT